MKIKKHAKLCSCTLASLGVFLGRGAQADTILDFETVPIDQPVNAAPGVLQSFGDNVTASSDGITVVGFGTPNIGLTWGAIGGADTRWDYYNDSGFRWSAAQNQDSYVGNAHTITFTPNNNQVSVVIKSFNFHPYYTFAETGERFTYDVTVHDGATIVSGPIHTSFQTDATKNHPISINYTGAVGHALELRLTRVASTLGAGEVEGDGYDIAVDDITFAQLPQTVFPGGPEVVSVSPANNQSGIPAIYYPYMASITNGSTAVVANSIQLRLDGNLVSPAPVISSENGLTNVSFVGTNLLTSGTHKFRLSYSDTGGSSYSHEVSFVVNYVTLPASYALPLAAGVSNGFTFRTVSASDEVKASTSTATNLASTVARAKAQLAGALINPDTSQPYTNSATLGTNADGSFSIDSVLNFADTSTPVFGNFLDDTAFPGLDSGTPSEWFSSEAIVHLALPAGYHRLGVNSDDGFELSALPPEGVAGDPIVLGLWDAGRGAANTFIDVLAPISGIYRLRLVYFEADGYANVELFSVTNLVTGDKVLVNDLTDPNALRSFRILKPLITSIVRSGSNVIISWSYGVPPFQLQTKTDLNGSWSNVGSLTTNRTATVPISGTSAFFRVNGS
jgi:hypothetical protein